MRKAIIYEWPVSQICMDCSHGSFIIASDSDMGSEYECSEDCTQNDGVNCPCFEQDKDPKDPE